MGTAARKIPPGRFAPLRRPVPAIRGPRVRTYALGGPMPTSTSAGTAPAESPSSSSSPPARFFIIAKAQTAAHELLAVTARDNGTVVVTPKEYDNDYQLWER